MIENLNGINIETEFGSILDENRKKDAPT